MKTIKKIFLAAAVAALSVVSARADYQISFDTLNDPSTPTNPIFDVGGVTRLQGSAGFVGQIYTSFSSVNGGAFTAIGPVTSFLNSGGAGFIVANPRDVTVVNASVTANPSPGSYQVRVWNTANGATYEAASAVIGAHVGISSSVSANFAGYVNGQLAPPSFPQANGFGSFSLGIVAVPEPATLALGLFGAAGLLARRRK